MTCLASHWRALGLLILSAWLLGGCLPSPQSQTDEQKEYHFLAGKSRVTSADYKGAVESFEKALEANPHSAAAHFELAILFDQQQSDPAAAIYHYSQYLKLREDADNAELVKTRIMACKQELARTVSLGPVTQMLQREFEQAMEANRQLKEEVEKWRAAYQAIATQVQAESTSRNQPGAVPTRGGTPSPGGVVVAVMTNPNAISGGTTQPNQLTSGTRGGTPISQPSATARRVHTVKAGETLSSIARQYNVKLPALQAANPRLDPRRVQIGTVVTIPPP